MKKLILTSSLTALALCSSGYAWAQEADQPVESQPEVSRPTEDGSPHAESPAGATPGTRSSAPT